VYRGGALCALAALSGLCISHGMGEAASETMTHVLAWQDSSFFKHQLKDRCLHTIASTLLLPLLSSSGALLVKGDNLFSEYWGRDQATKEAFTEDGWFMTGDSAEAVQLPAAEVAASGGITEYYRILGRTRCGEGNGDSFANPTSGWIHAE
jgi:acyl-CoA synthetase (AMP-forming)/AMP-acid ligase II